MSHNKEGIACIPLKQSTAVEEIVGFKIVLKLGWGSGREIFCVFRR